METNIDGAHRTQREVLFDWMSHFFSKHKLNTIENTIVYDTALATEVMRYENTNDVNIKCAHTNNLEQNNT